MQTGNLVIFYRIEKCQNRFSFNEGEIFEHDLQSSKGR